MTQNALIPAMLLTVSAIMLSANEPTYPIGWQKPNSKHFEATWRKKDKLKFLEFEADFNGDGIKDRAMILQPANQDGVGVFVFLSNQKNTFDTICLYDSTQDNSFKNNKYITRIQQSYMHNWGIHIAKPGRYKTAVGKGYFEPKPGEPDEIILKYPGINFFPFDYGGNRFFYYDTTQGKFLSQTMSD